MYPKMYPNYIQDTGRVFYSQVVMTKLAKVE
jgi:hypothetical protein